MMSCRYPEAKRAFGVLEYRAVAKEQTVQVNNSVLQLSKSHPSRPYFEKIRDSHVDEARKCQPLRGFRAAQIKLGR